jgi:hypothetical protein
MGNSLKENETTEEKFSPNEMALVFLTFICVVVECTDPCRSSCFSPDLRRLFVYFRQNLLYAHVCHDMILKEFLLFNNTPAAESHFYVKDEP